MAEINAAYDQIKNQAADSGGYSYTSAGSSSSTDYYAAIARFINNRQFQQAINLLDEIEDRTAQWYYLSSVANYGLNRRELAISQINTACNIEPNNFIYRQTKNKIENTVPFSPFGGFSYDFGGSNFETDTAPPTRHTTVFTTKKRGCLSKILRLILILIIIRFIIYSVMSLSHSRRYTPHQYPSTTYSQNQDDNEYDNHNDSEDYNRYFGENNGSTFNS